MGIFIEFMSIAFIKKGQRQNFTEFITEGKKQATYADVSTHTKIWF